MQNFLFLLLVLFSTKAFTQIRNDEQTKMLLMGKWQYKEYNLTLKDGGACEIEWSDDVIMNSTWALKNGILTVHSYIRKKHRYFTSKIYKYKIIDISNKELRFYPINTQNSKKIIIAKRLDR